MEKLYKNNRRKYEAFVGEYISLSCHIENMVVVFLVDHFTQYEENLMNDFVEYFVSKEYPFASKLKTFKKIIHSYGNYEHFTSRYPQVLGDNTIKRIIKFRNIFAHAGLTHVHGETYKFMWLNNEYKEKNYMLELSEAAIKEEIEVLKEFNSIITEISAPIVDRESAKKSKD